MARDTPGRDAYQAKKKRVVKKRRKTGSLRDFSVAPELEGGGFLREVGEKAGDVAKSAARDVITTANVGARRGPKAAAAEAVDRPVKVGKRATRGASDLALGPNLTQLLAGEDVGSKKWLAAEIALLPANVFAPLRSVTVGTKVLRGAKGTAKGVQAARKGASAAEAAKIAKESAKTPVLRVPRRQFKVNDSVAEIASARTRSGRAAEKAFDRARPVTSKLGVGKVRLVKDETQKWAQATQSRIKFGQKVDMLPGVRLNKVASHLKVPHQYALRSMAMGIDPLEAARFHVERAAGAEDPLTRSSHMIHADGYKKAAKFVLRNGDELELGPNAPFNLKKSWELLPDAAEGREEILKGLGLLNEEDIAARIQSPGRIIKGAKYTPEEEWADIVIRESPNREALREAMQGSGISDSVIEAQLKVMDTQSRSHWEKTKKSLEKRLKDIDRKMGELLDAEAEGDEIDEVVLRNLEDEAVTLSEQLKDLGYDDLYRRLGGAYPEFGPEMKAWDQFQYGRDAAVFRKTATGDPQFAKAAAAEIAAGLGRKGKLNAAKLEKGINTLLEYARQGAQYRYWYEVSAKRIMEIVGGNKRDAERIAQLVAIYSPQNEIMPNMAQALKAWKQWKAGEGIKVATGDKDRKALAVLQGGDYDGRKTNTFYRNMLEDIDPQKYEEIYGGDDVTVDRWMYRIFGLGDSDTGYYSTIQDATRAATKHLGFEKPKHVQAASWVVAKKEGLKQRFPKLSDEEAMERAMKSYADAIDDPNYTTRFPLEARPGSSDVIPEYSSWTPEVQTAFLEAKVPALNRFFEAIGLPFTVRATPGRGFWLGENGLEVNPAIAIDVHSGMAMSTKTAQDLAKAGEAFTLSPEETALWDSVAGAMATAFNQHAASWFRPLRAANRSQETLVHVSLGRGVTEQEMVALSERLGGDAWFSHADDGVYIARANWSELGMPEWRSLVTSVTDELGDGQRTWYGHVSGYLEGDDLARSVSDGRGPEELSRARGELRQASEEVDAAFRADPEGAAARARGEVDGSRATARGEDPDDGRVLGGREGERSAAGDGDSYLGGRGRAIPRTYDQQLDTLSPSAREEFLAKASTPAGAMFSHGVHVPPGHIVNQSLGIPSEASTVHVSKNTLVPTETWVHELTHFWQLHFPGAEKKLKRLLGDNKEDWVESYMEYVLDLYPQRSIPRAVRSSFDDLSEAILREARTTSGAHFVAQGMPRELAELFDSTLWYRELKGGTVRGAEDFAGGTVYTPFERGFPVSVRHPLASTRAYMRSMVGLFSPRRGGSIGKGFVDPSTVKQFRGYLLENGWYKADVTKATADSLAKAVKMDVVSKARAKLLEIAQPAPTRADDVPIKINPSKDAPHELKRWWETVEQMPTNMAVKHLDIEGLKNVDATLFADLTRNLSPDMIDGMTAERVAADIVAGVREPIENIVWVPAKAIYEGDLFSNPKAFFTRGESWGNLEVVGQSFDVINDFMKASLLQLNPAYMGMNLLGNLALNLMQQGPFALMNLPRAAFLSRELTPDLAAAVDHFMGRGISHVAQTRTIATRPSRVLADITGEIVDKIPRRAAFLHEAWAQGYRSADDIAHLLTNPSLQDDLYEVTQRANDAIIDYERLSPLERKIVARTVFIYPWIKGATRYTFRFPLEHPVQAMAMAVLYERQQAMADQELGERPWYSEFLVPTGTVERYGEEYPQVINPKQLLPFTTPLEFGQALAGAVTGNPETQPFIEILQPFYPALATSLTGWDSFEEREVGRGVRTLVEEMVDIPIRDRLDKLGMSEEERAEGASNRLYPRNERDEILKTFLGTLAPSPYNPEKGEYYAGGNRGKTPEQRMREKAAQIEGFYDPALQPKVDLALRTKVEFEDAKEAARKKLGTDNLTDVQLTEAMLDVALANTEGLDRNYIMGQLNAETAGKIRGALEAELGWNVVDAATRVANEKLRADEAKAEGAVVSAG